MKKLLLVSILAISPVFGCDGESNETEKASSDEVTKAAEAAFTVMNTELLISAPTEVVANEIVTLKPAAKHHFEMKAPQKCADFEFLEKTPREIACQITRPGTHRIEVNVCADDKSYCKPVHFEVEAKASRGYTESGESRKVLQPPRKQHPPVEGFLINEPEKAQKQAKNQGALIFAHFYGTWCPPCNLLEENVYGKEAFMTATEGMVRIMLDADSDLSWEWKDRFKVGGYPTVIIADSDLREIDRVVGYRPPATIVEWVQSANENADSPIRSLVKEHASDVPGAAPDDVRKRIGMWRYRRGEYEKAIAWLDGHPDADAIATARKAALQKAQKKGDEKAQIAALNLLVEHHSDDVAFSRWVRTLVELDEPGAEKLVPSAMKNLNDWAASPNLAKTGYKRADLAWLKADLHEVMGREEEARQAYQRSADLNGELAEESSLKLARGANLERAHALHKAGESEEARDLYERLIEAYEDEFVFEYNYSHVLHELGENEEAYEHVNRAVKNAYGDNWLRAVHLKAKLEKELGKTNVAKTTIESALEDAVVPRSTDLRTHRYLSRLRTLRGELDTATNSR